VRVHLKEVHAIEAEAPQAALELRTNLGWRRGRLDVSLGGPRREALGEHERSVNDRNIAQRDADHFLAMAVPVQRRGVDPVHTTFDSASDGRDRLRVVLRTKSMQPTHSTGRPSSKPDEANVEVSCAQPSRTHRTEGYRE
jgi:hypothetical protein